MKYLLLLGLVAFACADKLQMLEDNKVPTGAQVGTTCDECQSLVQRFVAAAKDPAKLMELKTLLKVLCHETSYVEECRVFVDNLDNIVKKLEPWLSDAHRVCRSIHMCSNSRLDAFRRVGMLYVKQQLNKAEGMKDLVCDECTFAASELKSLVEDKEQQKAIREFFANNVCIHAGSYRGMCDMLVEQFLPELFLELETMLKDPKKACADVGFCPRKGVSRKLTVPQRSSAVSNGVAFWEGARYLKTSRGQVMMSCFECQIEVDVLLDELITRKDPISADIQVFACDKLLPKNFTASCNDFLSMYLPTVWFMTVKQFSGEGICASMHTCDEVSSSRMAELSPAEKQEKKCEACNALQNFAKDAFLEPEAVHKAIAQVHQNVCAPVPAVWREMCHSVSAGVVPRMMTKAAELSKQHAFCKAC